MKKKIKDILESAIGLIRIEKAHLIPTFITVLCALLVAFFLHRAGVFVTQQRDFVTVGFVCNGDESTAYSENFLRVVDVLDMNYGDKIEVIVRSNVPDDSADKVIEELAQLDCDIIFTNSYSFGEHAKAAAQKYPDIQFCQATCSNANSEPQLDNYHTFMGEVYEGWYTSGRVAGLQLKKMIDEGTISEGEAWLGFIGAYRDPETISSYTAFLLGARRECACARMKVRYTESWANYPLENETANVLLREGCIIISQDTDTCGAAVACENIELDHPVYHISYNQDMINFAPNTTLIGTRIEWSPYICGAVDAVINNKKIENVVEGHIHGNDVGGGFRQGWIKMLYLNRAVAPEGSEEIINESIDEFQHDLCPVFYGSYKGKDPYDKSDVCDLSMEYRECRFRSAPSFHYILNDIVVEEE